MLFAAFPIVFQQERGWSPGIGGLSFLGVLVGFILALAYIIFIENPRYTRNVNVCRAVHLDMLRSDPYLF
jgi:hypothetical protein